MIINIYNMEYQKEKRDTFNIIKMNNSKIFF